MILLRKLRVVIQNESMTTISLIRQYLSCQPTAKQQDMRNLHQMILQLMPGCRLWFLDGKDDKGKVVSNPNIGYGHYIIHYADGSTKPFYQIGLSANSSGISVYIMGLPDKNFLPATYGKSIGKATVTGYCIKFKALKDIKTEVLNEAILESLRLTSINI